MVKNKEKEVVFDVVGQVHNYLKKNFPKRKLLEDKKMLSEYDIEVYGFSGIQVLVRDCGEYVRYYPLIPSYKILCNK